MEPDWRFRDCMHWAWDRDRDLGRDVIGRWGSAAKHGLEQEGSWNEAAVECGNLQISCC